MSWFTDLLAKTGTAINTVGQGVIEPLKSNPVVGPALTATFPEKGVSEWLEAFYPTEVSASTGETLPATEEGSYTFSDYPTGIPTSDTLGTTAPPTGDDSGMDAEQSAILQWLVDMEAAQLEGGLLRNKGQDTFDNLMNYANDFSTRAKDLFTNSGQEITNTFSGIAGDTARLGQSARTRAANAARAGGYGDSSRLGLMNQVTGSLAGRQGQNMARRGENEMANLSDYNAKEATAETQRLGATNSLNTMNDYATDLERLGMKDATVDFASLLTGIRDSNSMLAGMNPLNPNALSSFAVDSGGIPTTLNALNDSLATPTSTDLTSTASNLALNPASILDLLRKQ